MFKKIIVTFTLFTLAGQVKAQNIRIDNTANNTDITDSSIQIRYTDNSGFQGYESLNLGIKITNISNNIIEVGAKKIEEDPLQSDVQHTICFAGNCYPTNIFVSPNHIQLAPGASDSGFLAHFMFDNRIHIPGISHVSYTFYNADQPSDSVMVNVAYNTNSTTGIGPVQSTKTIEIYPNPARDRIIFRSENLNISLYKSELCLVNMSGKILILHPDNNECFNVGALPEGVYHYRLTLKENNIISGRLSIFR